MSHVGLDSNKTSMSSRVALQVSGTANQSYWRGVLILGREAAYQGSISLG